MKQVVSSNMSQQAKKAADVLLRGGVVAYPTDTIYGLGADIYNDSAVKRVFAIKQRPLDLPFPVLISDPSQMGSLVLEQTRLSKALTTKFWPGGLTVIFHKAEDLHSPALAGSTKIGIRMPAHPLALLMIRELGRPVIGTSANLHGGGAPLTADDVVRELDGSVDLIIDAGPCPGGQESTIIDVTVDPPLLIRHGIISEKYVMAEYNKVKGGK
jgi:L-threonylcarbamoyladenylate synthase